MDSLKPICVPCRRFYRPKKNGYNFIEGMPAPGGTRPTPPGNLAPEQWKPYKLWSGDLWECEGCLHQLIKGCAEQPLSEHYMPDFEEKVVQYAATFQVNDC